jgi:hypothetical protein
MSLYINLLVAARARDGTRADISAGAGFILHDKGLAEFFAQLTGKTASDHIRTSPGRERHNHRHRARRPCFGMTRCRLREP